MCLCNAASIATHAVLSDSADGGQQYRPYEDWKGCDYEYGVDHTGSDGFVFASYARSAQECCKMCFYEMRCRAPRVSCDARLHLLCQLRPRVLQRAYLLK